jgi:Kef-type K+ transport system membrane component KefB
MAADWLLALLDVLAIAALAWLGGVVAQRLRQPRIAGEMTAVFLAGLLLGGQIADVVPGQQAGGRIGDLFVPAAVTLVTVVGGIGLILYMLLVGMTIDPAPMRERWTAIALLTLATIAATAALALVTGPLLVSAGGWKPAGVGDAAFVIALAAALAANGVPIVARILEDCSMQQSPVGIIVIVAATCVTALSLIASAVAIDGGDVQAGGRVALRVGVGGLVLVLALVSTHRRPLALAPGPALVIVLALALLSGLAGDKLLSSLLIGPLVLGVVVQKGGAIALDAERRLGAAVRRVGLPVFLGLAALHTDLRQLAGGGGGGGGVAAAVVALLAAVIALKLAAGYGAARLAGLSPVDARSVGALLQCGGIMTIAISLDALDAGVIDARTHATLTLVGLVSTIVVGPLLPRTWTRRGAPREPAPATAGGPA